ncbi:MAG: rRNA maturation RNase YbeY [Bifidobacteriaceae bacterium]|jgi:probable rRNA maturation factor|nr:rRNA maturation RNase YbeY [Bifidobacteriaceae bacterium]
MSVEVLNETTTKIDELEFAQLGRFVLDSLNVHPQAELVISFVDPNTIAELHERFLDEPGPTDVMSFPMDELRPGSEDEPGRPGILGDVVVCPDVAAEQAREMGQSLEDELLVLATHGILHLLGFDHAEPNEREAMFGLQRKLVLAFIASR